MFFYRAPFPFPGIMGAPLMAALAAGAFLYSMVPLLDGASEGKVVYAYVDGEPVKSYVAG